MSEEHAVNLISHKDSDVRPGTCNCVMFLDQGILLNTMCG